ncbi:MAG: plasmid replication protein, CyRepA1 family [Heteroscytonema crispum UTEX LB 1556]
MHSASLNSQHCEELVKLSGIDLHLASLNFRSLGGKDAYEYLLISECLLRTNTGIISRGWLQRYAHVKHGGWWCSGLDPLANWELMEWGCFKPNHPKQDENDKLIKYEHPPSTPTRVFCLRVTLQIWQKVSVRYNIPMSENISITEDGEAVGFWQWVVDCKVPVIVCEGAKKAAALLSCGYAALAISGITSGYRTIKDEFGNVTNRQLIPELAAFVGKRTFYICFDYETKPKTIKAVNNAIAQLGGLLQEKNCAVKVIALPGLEKGVDDFIVAKGAIAFEQVHCNSIDLEIYLAQTKLYSELTIPASLTLNRRYLEEVPFPASGLVGVKSAKGTGKTTALLTLVNQAKIRNQPVLLITHRIQLGRFLCDKIGVGWGIGKGTRATGVGGRGGRGAQGGQGGRGGQGGNSSSSSPPSPLSPLSPPSPLSPLSPPSPSSPPSFGLCVDSIWKLNPKDWQGAIIILDEVEQCLWHLLNSGTCKEKRVKILRVFQELISTVLQTGGLVIAQDADLSDLSLEYLQGLSGVEIKPWVVINEWKPKQGWDVTFYDSPNPTPLIHQLELDLIAGRKCYVTTDSCSGRYSSETIELYIKQRLESFKKQYPKTLVISSQTTSTIGHEAVDFVENINQKISDYDAVFVTPSLGTGVSIDVEHFDRVYGIFQGVITDSEARQALARVRSNVPRIVWCAKRGIGLIGSGSKNYRVLSYWYQQNHKENLALMNPIYKIDVDMPLVYDPIHLRVWAKFAARVNASMTLYRQSMKDGLIGEGHQVNVLNDATHDDLIKKLRHTFLATDASDTKTRIQLILEIVKLQNEIADRSAKAKSIKKQIRKIKQQEEFNLALEVANAKNINRIEYERLLTHSLTDSDRNQIKKYILQQRYGVEVTPLLKLRDDKGYYWQLLTHYYLTHESEYFRFRDKQEWYQQLSWGDGQVFLPDLKTYTLKVEALRALGVLQILEPEKEFQENNDELILLKQKALYYSKHIKRAIGVNLVMESEKDRVSSIKILSRVLNLLGLKLKRINYRSGAEENTINIYQIDPATLNDGRQAIFEIWHERDALILETAKISEGNVSEIGSDKCVI